jgi:hypothetical protein
MKKAPKSGASPTRKPNPRQQRFIDEYLVDLNATQAAIRAGYSKRCAAETGYDLLRNPHIAAAVAEAQQQRAKRTHITQDEVLKRWAEIATADARELVEYQRGPCRFCWGVGHQYQWRTEREYNEAANEAIAKELPPPSNAGGFGYTTKREINPDCPECDGRGHGQLVVKDTRNLSGPAALLYAGTQIGKDGIKVLMESRDAALTNVAKHLGMLDPRLTLKGDAENPLQLLLRQMQGTALKPTAGEDDASD